MMGKRTMGERTMGELAELCELTMMPGTLQRAMAFRPGVDGGPAVSAHLLHSLTCLVHNQSPADCGPSIFRPPPQA
jgi:hypothetical protein